MTFVEKSTRTPDAQSQGIMAGTSYISEPLAKKGRLLSHLTEDIRSSSFAESQLVFLTFCTGMQGERKGSVMRGEAN